MRESIVVVAEMTPFSPHNQPTNEQIQKKR